MRRYLSKLFAWWHLRPFTMIVWILIEFVAIIHVLTSGDRAALVFSILWPIICLCWSSPLNPAWRNTFKP